MCACDCYDYLLEEMLGEREKERERERKRMNETETFTGE